MQKATFECIQDTNSISNDLCNDSIFSYTKIFNVIPFPFDYIVGKLSIVPVLAAGNVKNNFNLIYFVG